MGEELIPVQVRLAPPHIALLDKIRDRATQQVAGVRSASRPDALKLVLVLYGQRLLDEWGEGSPDNSPVVPSATPAPSVGPALTGLEEVATEAHETTPLQQVALAVPAPQAVKAAATVPVPELENSIDLGGAGFDPAKFTLGKLCKGKHEYGQTGQTLLRLPARVCDQCERERRKQKRAQQREGKR